MVSNEIKLGQIDVGIHPDLHYLSGFSIRLTRLDKEGYPDAGAKTNKGDLHGSQVTSVICGPYYEEDLPRITGIEAISIPRSGKTMLCLLRALDTMLASEIRILCLPVGINLPTPVFRPFIKALAVREVLVVAPSGNKGIGSITAPGSYPEVLTVGALNKAGGIESYSGRIPEGPEAAWKPNLFARGEFPDPADPDSGKTIRGTSMACAFVAGKAARIWKKFPQATTAEIIAQLGAQPFRTNHLPSFLTQQYIDSRLKAAINRLGDDAIVEGIVMTGIPWKPLSIDQLLMDVEAIAGCTPVDVNTFGVDNVVHLYAPKRYFSSLLNHKGLYCAQAVDVSMFDV